MPWSNFPLASKLDLVALSARTNQVFFKLMVTAERDVNFEMNRDQRQTAWGEKESNFPVDRACKCGVIFSGFNHAVPSTMGPTSYDHFSFGSEARIYSAWPWELTKQTTTAWIYTLWLWKKEPPKIFISSLGSAKVKTTACLCSDMKPISVMELSKHHKKAAGCDGAPLTPAHLGWWLL